MALKLKHDFRTVPVIDLDGPDGNAFALMAHCNVTTEAAATAAEGFLFL